jgi:hypothetical protein
VRYPERCSAEMPNTARKMRAMPSHQREIRIYFFFQR